MARGERWVQTELFPRVRKRCTLCGELKLHAEFHRNRGNRDGLQSRCRPCNIKTAKQFHAENPEHCRYRIGKWIRHVDGFNKRRVLAYLLEHPCVDCGEADPVVLEFDHRRGKEHGVGELLHRHVRWEVVEAEIARCEVRCANCHRRRHAHAMGWFRAVTTIE